MPPQAKVLVIPRRKTVFIVHVFIHVKPDQVAAFQAASLDNARNSLQEPGVARFDVLQQTDDPTRFVFIEVYRNQEATAKHKETQHYNVWRDTVDDMMAEPRQVLTYLNLFPDDGGWG